MKKNSIHGYFLILAQCLSAILFAQHVESKEIKTGIHYQVVFEISQAESSALEKLLILVSEAHRLEDKPPMSFFILNRRAETDLEFLQKALRSRGYYNAKISYLVDKKIKPVKLIYQVDTGKKYLFGKIKIQLDSSSKAKIILPESAGIGLNQGGDADARAVLQAEKNLIIFLKKQSYAFAKLSHKKFIIDHKNESMDILFEVYPGPSVQLGETQFKGVQAINEKLLQGFIEWKKGDLYHPDLLKKTTQKLVDSDLFSTIRIELSAADKSFPLMSQTVPIVIHLKERLHRSIKAQAGFDTDTGVTIGAKWTHRNYFGAGERLSIEAAWTGVGPLLDVKFNKPFFYSSKQSFLANLKVQNENTDAYQSTSLNMGIGIERKFQKKMKISLGLIFKQSSIKDKSFDIDALGLDSSNNFSLLYSPLKFTWDYSNNLFDPDKGGKFLLQGAPFIDTKSDLVFSKIYSNYIQYLKLMSQPRLILAGRFAIGQILGAQSYQLPADERFYSGGGGSVRGYAYQLIGPLDLNNSPLGGNALLEFALESRLSITQAIATVIFVDAGSIYSNSFFDGSSEILYGAGMGLRYASPMGPLRADIAIPVNPRKGVDASYQIYISIGQAF